MSAGAKAEPAVEPRNMFPFSRQISEKSAAGQTFGGLRCDSRRVRHSLDFLKDCELIQPRFRATPPTMSAEPRLGALPDGTRFCKEAIPYTMRDRLVVRASRARDQR